MSETSEILEAPAENLLQAIEALLGKGFLATSITVILVLVATAFVVHLSTRLLRRILAHDNSPLPSSTIFVNIARVVIWGMGFSIILSTCFGVDVTAAVAALGIGGIALSLGFQDTISNLIGGLQISILGIVEPGDHIDVSGSRGVVHDVTWRNVTIETPTGGLVVVPNAAINKSAFVKLPPAEKVVVPVNFEKSVTDLDAVAKRVELAAKEAVQGVATITKDPVILFDAVTEFGYGGSLVVWIESRDDLLATMDALVRAVAPFEGTSGQ